METQKPSSSEKKLEGVKQDDVSVRGFSVAVALDIIDQELSSKFE